mmetsp:Transcript_44967/g.103990  ORF Transcript_44967/g.103990 Transcript_44967/m.103990 type:complete len:204 (+) Transcript_44967:56-667(+)
MNGACGKVVDKVNGRSQRCAVHSGSKDLPERVVTIVPPCPRHRAHEENQPNDGPSSVTWWQLEACTHGIPRSQRLRGHDVTRRHPWQHLAVGAPACTGRGSGLVQEWLHQELVHAHSGNKQNKQRDGRSIPSAGDVDDKDGWDTPRHEAQDKCQQWERPPVYRQADCNLTKCEFLVHYTAMLSQLRVVAWMPRGIVHSPREVQ